MFKKKSELPFTLQILSTHKTKIHTKIELNEN